MRVLEQAANAMLRQLTRSSAGIDVSPDGLAAVELGPTLRGIGPLRSLIVTLPAGVAREAALRQALSGFLSTLGPSVPVTVTVRPVGLRGLRFPSAPADLVAKVLPFQVSHFTPLPIQELACAVHVAPGAPGPVDALAAWARKTDVTAALPGARRADHAQPLAVALHRFARQYRPQPPGTEVAIASVGSSWACVVVSKDDALLFARQFACDPGDGTRLAAALRSCFQQVFFTASPRMLQPARVLLAAREDALAGLAGALSSQLSVPVEPLEPAGLRGLAAAAGAALCPLATGALSLDLAPAPAPKRAASVQIPALPSAVFLLALLLDCCAHWIWAERTRQAAAAAQAELAAVWPGAEASPEALAGLGKELRAARERVPASRILAALERSLGKAGEGGFGGLETLETGADGTVRITGFAASYQAVTRLLQSLEESGHFSKAAVHECEAAPGTQQVRFRMTARVAEVMRS